MKRLLLLLLTLALSVSLIACDEGSSKKRSSKDKDDSTTEATVGSDVVPTEDEVADPTEEPTEDETDTPTEEPTEDQTDVPLETTDTAVVIDNEECLVKINGLGEDDFFGTSVKIELENRSADKTYMFSLDDATINGVQVNPLFASEVAPGKKANETMYFMDDAADESVIGAFTDIELTFSVSDSEDWMADAVATETVHIYPLGKDKATRFVREAKDTDTVIVDNEYLTLIVTDYEPDALLGYTANMYIVNKTDKELMLVSDDESVNGYMMDSLFAMTVLPGKSAFGDMSWLESDFEENGITEVTELQFTLRAYDSNDWMAENLVNEKITLNP